MRRILFTILLLLSTIVGRCQYKAYDLNSYTNPELQRKTFDITLNSKGSLKKDNHKTLNDVNGLVGFLYSNLKNSEKIQKLSLISCETDLNYRNLDSTHRQTFSEVDLNFNLNQKAHYYVDERHFLEVSPRLVLTNYFSKSKQAAMSYNNRYSRAFEVELEVDLGVGKGRIENATDARQAIYILEALQSKGILKKSLSSEEINSFAKQISIVKNKRHFDARQRAIDELSYIDRYLTFMGYIDPTNTADYFLTLNDYWQNGDHDLRQAGYRFKLGLAPTYIFNRASQTYEENKLPAYKELDTKWGGTFYLDYLSENPISLKVQRSFNAGVRNGLYRWRSRSCNEFLAHGYAKYELGFFRSTRTYIKWRLSEDLYWNHTPRTKQLVRDNIFASRTNLTAEAYYYITPQLRIAGSYTLSYDFYRSVAHNKNFYDKLPASKFDLGFVYSIF